MNRDIKFGFYNNYERFDSNFAVVRGQSAKYLFLNEFEQTIYRLAKNYSYGELINKVMWAYDEDGLELAKKAESILNKFRNFGILYFVGEKSMFNDGFYLVGENSFKMLSQFCKDYINKKIKVSQFSFLNNKNIEYFDTYNLRTNDFYMNENYYVQVVNNKIVNLLIMSGLSSKNGTLCLNGLVSVENYFDDVASIFSFMLSMLPREVNKIKYQSLKKPSEIMETILMSLGFVFETILTKEYCGNDVYIYSFFINKG